MQVATPQNCSTPDRQTPTPDHWSRLWPLVPGPWSLAPGRHASLLHPVQRGAGAENECFASHRGAGHKTIVELVLGQFFVLRAGLHDASDSVLAAIVDLAIGGQWRGAEFAG